MAKSSRTRSSRTTARRPASGPRTRTTARSASARTRPAAGNGKARTAEPEVTRGSRRTCEAPGCGKSFRAYVARQRFCSNGCRSRAFYWDFKERTGERYAAHLAADVPAPKTRARARRTSRRA